MPGQQSNEEILHRAAKRLPRLPIRLRLSFQVMVQVSSRPVVYTYQGLRDTSIRIAARSPGHVWRIIRGIAKFCQEEYGGDRDTQSDSVTESNGSRPDHFPD